MILMVSVFVVGCDGACLLENANEACTQSVESHSKGTDISLEQHPLNLLWARMLDAEGECGRLSVGVSSIEIKRWWTDDVR